jgi:hypothetical protein
VDLNANPTNFASIDDYLIATTKLEGDDFNIDNARLYNDIKPLLVDSCGHGRSPNATIGARMEEVQFWRCASKPKGTLPRGPERPKLTLR